MTTRRAVDEIRPLSPDEPPLRPRGARPENRCSREERSLMIKRYTSVLVSATLILTVLIAFVACGGSSSTTPTPSKAGAATVKPSSSATTAATAATSATSGSTTLATAANAALGENILVDSAGKTLYTYDKDTADTSACTGACA